MARFLRATERTDKYVRSMLSGRIPTSEFIRKGHPLSRRGRSVIVIDARGRRRKGHTRGFGSVPLLPINEQTGELNRSTQKKVRRTRNEIFVGWTFGSSKHRFTAMKNAFIHQVPRRFVESVQRKARQEMKKF